MLFPGMPYWILSDQHVCVSLIKCASVGQYVTTTTKMTAGVACLQGGPNDALQTLTDAEISATKQQLGSIASAIPGYSKLDPHCNGFVCNAGDVGQDISCDDAFIAQKKDDFCGVSGSHHT